MAHDDGRLFEELAESTWDVISEHRAGLGVFGAFFWGAVFAIREAHAGTRFWPYVAFAATFFIALCVVSLAIERPIDKILKRLFGDNEGTPVMATVFALVVAWICLVVLADIPSFVHGLNVMNTTSPAKLRYAVIGQQQ